MVLVPGAHGIKGDAAGAEPHRWRNLSQPPARFSCIAQAFGSNTDMTRFMTDVAIVSHVLTAHWQKSGSCVAKCLCHTTTTAINAGVLEHLDRSTLPSKPCRKQGSAVGNISGHQKVIGRTARGGVAAGADIPTRDIMMENHGSCEAARQGSCLRPLCRRGGHRNVKQEDPNLNNNRFSNPGNVHQWRTSTACETSTKSDSVE